MFFKKVLSFFRVKPSDKHFLLALLAIIGVVFVWRGAWVIMDITPIIQDPFVSFFIGLIIVTFTGVIYREFLPEEEPFTEVLDLIKEGFRKPNKRERFLIRYYDEVSQKHHEIKHAEVKKIEHNYLIVERSGKEVFVPIHRVREIHQDNKMVWKSK